MVETVVKGSLVFDRSRYEQAGLARKQSRHAGLVPETVGVLEPVVIGIDDLVPSLSELDE